MPPINQTLTMLQDWIESETKKKHSMAVKYIEENVDLIDTDLQKFMEDCPHRCQLEVCEMLLKAGIDIKDYTLKDSLKKWDIYLHDGGSHSFNPFKIDIEYEDKVNNHVKETLTWKTDWRSDCIVLDTLGGVVE